MPTSSIHPRAFCRIDHRCNTSVVGSVSVFQSPSLSLMFEVPVDDNDVFGPYILRMHGLTFLINNHLFFLFISFSQKIATCLCIPFTSLKFE